MVKTRRLLAVVLVSAGLAACAAPRPVALRFAQSAPDESKQDFANWPVEPLEAERLLAYGEYEVLSVESAGSGTTRPTKAHIRFLETGDEFNVKGKPVPEDLDGINNSPRKELAAWKLQMLFLDPVDYTVPATALRCVPLDREANYTGQTTANIAGTDCRLREVTVWMEDVTLPDALYEQERFANDVAYAYHLANFNILAYLINLRDNRTGNVLVSKDPANRRVFAVDNGVSFGTIWYNWIYPPTYAWRTIRVPALPRRSVDRLRAVGREDLDFLMVVAQMEVDAAGVLHNVAPGPPIEPDGGANFDGKTLQLGLTRSEIDAVWQRIRRLVERVDAGEIALF